MEMTSEERARYIVEHKGVCSGISCVNLEGDMEERCPYMDCGCERSIEDAKTEDSKAVRICEKFLASKGMSATANPVSKYNRPITGMDGAKTTVDVYRVLVAFGITDPELQHSLKKLLNLGIRGKGDYTQDLDEAILSLQKMKERKEQECK